MKEKFSEIILLAIIAALLLSGCQNNGVSSKTTADDAQISSSLLLSVQDELSTVDADSDSILDQEERKVILEKLNNADTMTPELKEALISLFDKNADGAITADEVPTRVPARPSLEQAGHLGLNDPRGRARHMFCPPSDIEIPDFTTVAEFVTHYDADGDGLLSQHEIPGWAVIISMEESIRTALFESGVLDVDMENLPENREEMLARFDADNDGRISAEEFKDSGILAVGMREKPHFKDHHDAALSNQECRESCGEIMRFYRDLFASFSSTEDFIAEYDLNADGLISPEEFPVP